MDDSRDTVGAFEAKTHLSGLLDEVEQGRSITITRRGKPVARLVPIGEPQTFDAAEMIERFRRLRAKVKGNVDVVKIIREMRDSR